MLKFDFVTRFRQVIGDNGAQGKPAERLVLAGLVFVVGYILLLIGLARLVATSWGWNANLFLVGLGAVHVALGIMAVTASTAPADTSVDSDSSETAFERADTLVMGVPGGDAGAGALRPPSFPPRTRMSS